MDHLLFLLILIMIVLSTSRLLITSVTVGATPTPADRARLARVERQQRAIVDHFGIHIPEPAMPTVVECLMRGQRIHAVKAYRKATGAGLREAKSAVKEIARENGL